MKLKNIEILEGRLEYTYFHLDDNYEGKIFGIELEKLHLTTFTYRAIMPIMYTQCSNDIQLTLNRQIIIIRSDISKH